MPTHRMMFGRHMQKTNIYKTMKSFFWFFVQILNYVIKFPDWPLPGYHGNRIKNPASWFCANCSYVPPSQVWKYCENWFLSYVCYRVWPIRGLAWLPWQPDWNDNHFQKVRVMGFVVVYHPCGPAFRKVLKFDVENWAVDHWTPSLILVYVSIDVYDISMNACVVSKSNRSYTRAYIFLQPGNTKIILIIFVIQV